MICHPRFSVRSKAVRRIVRIAYAIGHRKLSGWLRGVGREGAQGLTFNVSEAVWASALRVSSRLSRDINVSLDRSPSNSVGSTPVLG